jgi:hypothetical protein
VTFALVDVPSEVWSDDAGLDLTVESSRGWCALQGPRDCRPEPDADLENS